MFYRHRLINEPWPDFLKTQDFVSRPALRVWRKHNENMSDNQQHGLFK